MINLFTTVAWMELYLTLILNVVATSDHLSVLFSVTMNRNTSTCIEQLICMNFDQTDLILAAHKLATVNCFFKRSGP